MTALTQSTVVGQPSATLLPLDAVAAPVWAAWLAAVRFAWVHCRVNALGEVCGAADPPEQPAKVIIAVATTPVAAQRRVLATASMSHREPLGEVSIRDERLICNGNSASVSVAVILTGCLSGDMLSW